MRLYANFRKLVNLVFILRNRKFSQRTTLVVAKATSSLW